MSKTNYLQEEFENLLRTDPKMWRFLQDGSLDGVWYWDLENPDQEWMSPEFWHLFGIDPATKRHDPAEWQDIIFQEDLEIALKNFDLHCANPAHPYDQIVRYRHADGSTVWVRCRGIAIRDETGKPIRLLGAHNDLTALKRAEVRARFGQMFEEAPVAMLLVGPGGAVRSANREALSITRFDRENLQQAALDQLVPASEGDTSHGWENALKRFATEGRDCLLKRSDGSLLPVEISLVPFDDDGELMHLAALVDVSERLAYQRILEERTAMLERINAELDQFAYIASHDLKEPLRGMAINAQFLMREALGDEAANRANRILALCDRMEQQISDLLYYSRLGQSESGPEAVDCVSVVEDIRSSLLEVLAEHNSEVRLKTPLPRVNAERTKIKTVFQNLIVNGLKYNDAENKIVDIGFVAEASVKGRIIQNAFYIRDNGIGIDEQFHDAMFSIFRRLNAEEDYGAGTGAGLSFVKKIVEEYEGLIAVDSAPGKGTTFYLTLPLSPAESVSAG